MAKKEVHDNRHDGVHDRTIIYNKEDGSKRIVDQRVHDTPLGELGADNTGERTVEPDDD